MKTTTLKDAIKFMRAYYLTNIDVLEAADKRRVTACLEDLREELQKPAPTFIERIEESYSEAADITFIMKYVYASDHSVVSTECIGWYYGHPDSNVTPMYVGKLKATY